MMIGCITNLAPSIRQSEDIWLPKVAMRREDYNIEYGGQPAKE